MTSEEAVIIISDFVYSEAMRCDGRRSLLTDNVLKALDKAVEVLKKDVELEKAKCPTKRSKLW